MKKKSIYVEEQYEQIVITEDCLEGFNHLLNSLDINKFLLASILSLSESVIIKSVKNTLSNSNISRSIVRIRDNIKKHTYNILLIDGDYDKDIQKLSKSKRETYKVVEKYVKEIFEKNKSIEVCLIIIDNIYYYFDRNGITDAGTIRKHIKVDIKEQDEEKIAV